MRCGQPSCALVAQMTTRCSSRKAAASSSLILIWLRRLTSGGPPALRRACWPPCAPRGALHEVESEVAHAVARRVEGRHVPALAPVHQRVGLHAALGQLVLVLLVVLHLEQPVARDGARDHARDLGVVAGGAGDLEALLD